jgi:hypothetical protein
MSAGVSDREEILAAYAEWEAVNAKRAAGLLANAKMAAPNGSHHQNSTTDSHAPTPYWHPEKMLADEDDDDPA